MFEDCQIVLLLDSHLKFKQKKHLKELITANGGVISYVVNKTVLNLTLVPGGKKPI